MRRAVFCALLSAAVHVSAADFVVAGFEYSPFTIVENNTLTGIAHDIATKLIADTGNTKTGNSTGAVKRMLEKMEESNVILAMSTRAPDREDKMQWIGKLADDTNCFFTPKESPVSTIEEAKKLSAVAVNAGGSTEKFLVDSGFQNIAPLANNALNFKKLEAGRVPAWYTSELISKYTLIREKGNPANFVCSGAIKKPSYWIAASLKTDKAIVEKMKAKFAEYEKSGELAKITAKYSK